MKKLELDSRGIVAIVAIIAGATVAIITKKPDPFLVALIFTMFAI